MTLGILAVAVLIHYAKKFAPDTTASDRAIEFWPPPPHRRPREKFVCPTPELFGNGVLFEQFIPRGDGLPWQNHA